MLAPGEPIRSSMAYPAGSYAELSGTSMAAPHVAGAWAVLKGILPSASVTDIQQTLRETGQPISDTRVTSQPALVLPRIALNAAAALLRTASLPLAITPNGIEFGAVQRGTSAVGRITIQSTGVPVRMVRTAVSAPWVVTPLGCGTIIDDIADRCVYEVRYAPTSAAPLGWNATSIAVTLNGVRTLIGLSAQTVAELPAPAATQTAQVAEARLTQTPTVTPSATPLSHALALTHV
ncbi:MAG: S8 family serine peptidase, partial [Roseiflexaceae bacterium]